MTEVFMPIAPQIEQGSITVKMRVLSHVFEQNLEIGLEVLVRQNLWTHFKLNLAFNFIARRSDHQSTHFTPIGPQKSSPCLEISGYSGRGVAHNSILEIPAVRFRQSKGLHHFVR